MKRLLVIGLSSLIFLSPVLAETCGVITAQTGPLQEIGNAVKNGVILASKEFGENEVRFHHEDDQFQPKNTISIAKNFVEQRGFKCLIVFGGGTSMAVAPYAESKGVTMVAITITSDVVKNKKHVFQFYTPSEAQNKALIDTISLKKYDSIAIVTTEQDGTLALRKNLLASPPTKVIFDTQVTHDEKDFRAIATKIKDLNPPAVFINLLPPQLGLLSRQLRDLKYSGEFFGGAPLSNISEIKAAKGGLENTWFISLSSPQAMQFKARYQSNFKELFGETSLYGYETARLFIEAKKQNKTFKELVTAGTINSSLFGSYIFKDNMSQIPAGIWKIEGEDFYLK